MKIIISILMLSFILSLNIDKTFKDAALAVGVDDDSPGDGVYDLPVLPDTFKNFAVTFINLNPKDLRTYLKFENDLFLTTNFKQDLISVSEYPNSGLIELDIFPPNAVTAT